MTTAAEWLALAEKARQAKGPDHSIEVAIDVATGDYNGQITRSLDAIVTLTERMLPGHDWQLIKGGHCILLFDADKDQEVETFNGDGATPALSFVAAFCEAMAAQAQEKNDG